MMAWVMLLSFLPQVLVKGFHQHGTSLDKMECNFVARTLHAPSTSTAEDRNAQATQKQHENQRKHLAQHQKNSSDEGKGNSTDGHDCAICHFLISPFTPPHFHRLFFWCSHGACCLPATCRCGVLGCRDHSSTSRTSAGIKHWRRFLSRGVDLPLKSLYTRPSKP